MARRKGKRLSDTNLLRALRAAACRKQNNLCYWCKQQMTFADSNHPTFATADHHPIPKHNGGKTKPDNIIAACRQCNNGRHPELNKTKTPRHLQIGVETYHSPFAILKERK
jgi:5-methylcytosine-specific restriction endonuclease McrA